MLNFKDIFIQNIGNPKSLDDLDSYINFISSVEISQYTDGEFYTEMHHVLPRCLFPDYEHNMYNLSRLLYKDHIEAHKLLAKAYPINQFVRPLNFMLGQISKNDPEYKHMLSDARKASFAEFKTTLAYDVWRKKHSESTKNSWNNGIYDHVADLNKKRFEDIEYSENWGKIVSDRWKDEEFKDRTIQSMIIERNSEEGNLRMCLAAQERWDNQSEQERQNFCDKMSVINNNEEKKKKAGDKIKIRWDNDEEYKTKMKNRKPRGSDGSKMVEKWADPVWKAKTLENRRLNKLKRDKK